VDVLIVAVVASEKRVSGSNIEGIEPLALAVTVDPCLSGLHLSGCSDYPNWV